MREYTIQEDLRKVFNALEDIKDAVNCLEEKVKKAKLYPQLLANDMWCEMPGEK